MKVSFQGFGEGILTFETLNQLKVGSPVCMQANGTVIPCVENEEFCGIVVQAERYHAGVQVTGYIRVRYSGDPPAVGYQALCTDYRNGVKKASGGTRAYLVLDVDEQAGTVGFLLA